MLIDLTLSLIILSIVSTSISFTVFKFEEKETLVGIMALRTKFTAISTVSPQRLTIYRFEHPLIYNQYGECSLFFTSNGNTSQATTCGSPPNQLRLRPGKGVSVTHGIKHSNCRRFYGSIFTKTCYLLSY